MPWYRLYLRLAVLLVTPTAIRAGKQYSPSNCHQSSFSGTDCVLTCRGQDACETSVSLPKGSNLKNFVVRCVTDTACSSLSLRKTRSGVTIYLLCIPNADSCNSVEGVSGKSSYIYCEGGRGDCKDKYKNKRVKRTTKKNGIDVVIFNNDVAVGRSTSARGKDAGIISNPNGPFFVFVFCLTITEHYLYATLICYQCKTNCLR